MNKLERFLEELGFGDGSGHVHEPEDNTYYSKSFPFIDVEIGGFWGGSYVEIHTFSKSCIIFNDPIKIPIFKNKRSFVKTIINNKERILKLLDSHWHNSFEELCELLEHKSQLSKRSKSKPKSKPILKPLNKVDRKLESKANKQWSNYKKNGKELYSKNNQEKFWKEYNKLINKSKSKLNQK